jgi:hypothetical protein
MATDRRGHLSLIVSLNRPNGAWRRVDEREVTSSDTSLRELPGERRVHRGRFRDDHNPCRVLIESMNDSRTIGVPNRELLFSHMVNDRIRDSVRVVSRSWVHGDSGRLIEDDKVRVLEEDIKGKIER